MQELDPEYIELYWREFDPPRRNTMRYSIELSREDQANVEAVRAFINNNDDPRNDEVIQKAMRDHAKTLNGVVKIALATAAGEARRMQ